VVRNINLPQASAPRHAGAGIWGKATGLESIPIHERIQRPAPDAF
jgi:hypothetical protein